ncbi:hypothetical protein CYMTET_44763 [Cymbomonas tetramitiformis]|uniref:Uncharacterized protein n=1 Tax=Cymbomonas tetramitiformis TaxID=36881 RepID=A0AAE0C0T1_9CHLO|nr:hypothetical protein CYMTET_44763 [Cymbomonas tetramitiformis]
MPADGEEADEAMRTLALCQIFQVRAMEEKVGVHLSQFSLAGDEDVREHRTPVGAPFGQRRGGRCASAGDALAATRYMAHVGVPTEGFPGGVDLVPVRPYDFAGHDARAVNFGGDMLFSAGFRFRFVEPAEAIGLYSIDEYLADFETDEIEQSECGESFVGTLSSQSTGRPQQVIGCGAPPPGLRPNFVLLACFLRLLGIGFAGATGIGSASGGGMPAADAQPSAVTPPDYWRPEGHYATDHDPHSCTWYPGPSRPPLVVPYVGPPSPSPSSPPYSLEHEPEEVVRPTLNGDRQSTRDGLYIDDSYGMDLTAPLHRVGNNNIADIFTQPLPPWVR